MGVADTAIEVSTESTTPTLRAALHREHSAINGDTAPRESGVALIRTAPEAPAGLLDQLDAHCGVCAGLAIAGSDGGTGSDVLHERTLQTGGRSVSGVAF